MPVLFTRNRAMNLDREAVAFEASMGIAKD